MTWKYPKSWVFNEMVTAAKLNEEVLNRLNDLWKYSAIGDFMVASGAQDAERVPVGDNTEAFTCDDSQPTGTKWAAALPVGSIVIWSGSIASIPAGWALCDGSSGTPNLQDKFVIGAGNSYAVGATGGVATVDDVHTGHAASGSVAEVGYAGANPGGSPILAHMTHSHSWGSGGATGVDTIPPYYALAYIMRTA